MEKEKLKRKVKEDIEARLEFHYHDWDHFIEDGIATEDEIKEVLSELEVTWKRKIEL